MVNYINFRFFQLKKFEIKLRKYNGYRHNSITKWKKQMDLSWGTTCKVLSELRILTGLEIRQMLRDTIKQNQTLFDSTNCYICKFGKPGKSGEVILYEFSHGCSDYRSKVIEMWQIPSLPDSSTVIFIDDLLGTGTQSKNYINTNVNPFLNSSHNPFLLSLCATPQGISNVKDNTNFKVISHLLLNEQDFQHYSDKSKIFNNNERAAIKKTNDMLRGNIDSFFDTGLLIAFYYNVPNNTMPIIWKDNYEYSDNSDKSKKWFALLPRIY